ncbi:MAG: indole-3-glycerol phosphate synthase TrpC [Capsulimonadales bacterium]|nr:indole-3-glycerol phosphate synthase TrpC [Capsulimonadales bacterium]
MTGTVLDRILETKVQEIAELRGRYRRISDLIDACVGLPPTRGFRRALEARASVGKTGLIAEVKKASPSKGVIRADFDPAEIARAYEAGGATCLSVLTDHDFFQGRSEYLASVREAVALPLLRKDFLIDTAQVYESRLLGADAILLIVAAIPSPARLAEMRQVSESLGMDVLTEVHDRKELDLALESGATMIGVNNRDLRTFEVRPETFETLAAHFPQGTLAVAESGIFTSSDVLRMRSAGASAVLVGEALMRSADMVSATRALLAD